MPTARDFADSVRRPLEVAENAMLANNDEFAAAALIAAAQQAAMIAWMNMHDPLRNGKLENIVDELSRLASVAEKAGVDTAVQRIVDREEGEDALEHPEDSHEDGGMCMDEPRCFAAGDQRYHKHMDDCPAWAGLQIKDHRAQIEELQRTIDDNAQALREE